MTQIDSANVLFVPFPNFPPLMMMKRAMKRPMNRLRKGPSKMNIDGPDGPLK